MRYREVEFLAYFEFLETAILDHNLLCSKTIFPMSKSIKTLWINFNTIAKLNPFLDNLASALPCLEYLSMMGNPGAPSFVNGGNFHDYVLYRYSVIAKFMSLKYLDDRAVDSDAREQAKLLSKSRISRPQFSPLAREEEVWSGSRSQDSLKNITLKFANKAKNKWHQLINLNL